MGRHAARAAAVWLVVSVVTLVVVGLDVRGLWPSRYLLPVVEDSIQEVGLFNDVTAALFLVAVNSVFWAVIGYALWRVLTSRWPT